MLARRRCIHLPPHLGHIRQLLIYGRELVGHAGSLALHGGDRLVQMGAHGFVVRTVPGDLETRNTDGGGENMNAKVESAVNLILALVAASILLALAGGCHP